MKKRFITSVLAAVMLLTSASVCTASAASSKTVYYQGNKNSVSATYTVDTNLLKIDMFGTGKVKHMALTSKSTYFANTGSARWSKKRTYQSNQQGPYRVNTKTVAFALYSSGGVMCGGVGTNYNSNNFVFKYN